MRVDAHLPDSTVGEVEVAGHAPPGVVDGNPCSGAVRRRESIDVSAALDPGTAAIAVHARVPLRSRPGIVIWCADRHRKPVPAQRERLAGPILRCLTLKCSAERRPDARREPVHRDTAALRTPTLRTDRKNVARIIER